MTSLLQLVSMRPYRLGFVHCVAALAFLWSSTCGGLTPATIYAQDADESTEPADDVDDADEGDDAELSDVELLRLFADVLHEIEANYVDEVDRRELIEAAIDGMIDELDQHSAYIPPEELRRFRGSIENEYGGIGVQVSQEQGRLTVISPYYGSPAYRSGIMAGDTILQIEGFSTEGMTLERAVELTTGEVGTPVEVTVRHKHSNEVERIELLRAIIKMETVLGDERNGDDTWSYFLDDDKRIGYIRLTGFGRTTAGDLLNVINQMIDDDMEGLILDLRFNPGGLLSSAIQISDFFIDEGRIVSTEGRSTRPRAWNANERISLPDFPMVVLINRYSASASEIVAACLKDHERAVIIGERSFGKGSVQNVIPLEGGSRALKLTTAGYLRPNGKNIHRSESATEEDEWGVQPSEGFKIVLEDGEISSYLNYRRERDSIGADDDELGSSSNEEQSGEQDNVKSESESNGEETEDDVEEDETSNDEFVDRQLAKAIAYLNEQLMIRP